MKLLLKLLLASIFFALTLWVRCYYSQNRHLNLAVVHLERSEYKQAIPELAKSIRFKAPFLPPEKAVYLLFDIFKNQSDPEIRRDALLELKSALVSSNYTPQNETLSVAHIESYIRLTYLAPSAGAYLKEAPIPTYNILLQVLAGVTFLTWIGSVIFLIWNFTTPDGKIQVVPALKCSLVIITLFIGWLGCLAYS